ncbi:hypothetical protein PRZ48_011009 [Zasmidium cellare]|uniref:BTB domain-containing protein n=1 Tax=Zasmidium cellare TaxID=395010 RepID=A0ABR0EAT4_ZASCE|nr:hypothetical protein PRZ48_011009 [Zasmidium cellare]
MSWSIGQTPLPLRMAPAPSGRFDPKEIMTRSYGSGKYSDLTVRTPERDFKVHRMVVCEQCQFFEAALKHGWEESNTSVIEVKESAAAMDIVFRSMYGQSLPFLPSRKDNQATLEEKGTPDNFYLALDVLVAADKYLLDGLSAAADLSIVNCIRFAGVHDLVYFAAALQDLGQGQVGNLFALAVIKLSDKLEDLLRMEEAWDTLHARRDLQKLVLGLRLVHFTGENVAFFFEEHTGRPGTDFKTPSTRHVWYQEKCGNSIMNIG